MVSTSPRASMFRSAIALALLGCWPLAFAAAQEAAPTPAPVATPAPTAPVATPAPVAIPPATTPEPTHPVPGAGEPYQGITLPSARYIQDNVQYFAPPTAGSAPATTPRPIRRIRPAPGAPSGGTGESKPFTGFLRLRQKNGTLTYDINITRGKVVAGTETYQGSNAVTADIVGGWFDRDRLVLMIQSRNPNIQADWAAHLHQFRRSEEGFTIEHSLLGYAKSDENYQVYRPHTIERMVEFD